METRTINTMIRESESHGQYVYAKTPESIITGAWPRIIKARNKRGVQQVQVLNDGKWHELIDNKITIK